MSYECDVNDSLAQILVRVTDGFRYIEVKRSQQTTQPSSTTINNLKMKKKGFCSGRVRTCSTGFVVRYPSDRSLLSALRFHHLYWNSLFAGAVIATFVIST
jgi:hypothetical protein